MSYVLVADIGGTSSRFAIYKDLNSEALFQLTIATASSESFGDLLRELKKNQTKISFTELKSAVFAIAGPIVDPDLVNPPNIKWDINRQDIENVLGIKKSKFINDFQAQALSVLSLDKKFFKAINKGEAKENFPRAVIGAGTGFGKSLLVKTGNNSYQSIASEGGHNDFPVLDQQEFEFREFAKKKLESKNLLWDNVISGEGIELIHEFLSKEPISAAEISKNYLQAESDTLKLFAKFYARAARAYVLENMALGGLYIAGGVALKNPLILESNSFRNSFLDSKYSNFLANLPIYLVDSGDSGLVGAAYEAIRNDFLRIF